MKKSACFLLALVIIIGTFSGCAQDEVRIFTSDNEIITYDRIDAGKTQIVVSRTGNIAILPLCEAFEENNGDIQIIYRDITGGNEFYTPIHDWAANGDLPDVVFMSANMFDAQKTEQYFVNLSGDPIIANYEAAALQRTATNSNVYMLPGPSDITAIMYNKTLFEKYGWEVPATFDEFVTLCNRIREDTDGEIESWNPNAKYGNELIMALEAMTYEQLLGGVENRTWYNDFIEGQGTFAGHMEPYTEALQTLIDNGILKAEHFSYSATTRAKEFVEGKIAMINMPIYIPVSDEFEFGYMPFPTTSGEVGYICDKYSCFMGLPKKEHTEKETEAIKRFVTFVSSAEGQQAYINNSLKVSNVKGVLFNQTELLKSLQPAIDAGHLFGIMDFKSAVPGKSVWLHGIAEKMVIEGSSGSECIAEIDRTRAGAVTEQTSETPKETVAVAADDFTILETSFLIADAYREIANADVGLITHGGVYRGNLMRIYKGDLTADVISVFKPRSFANDSTLVSVSMNGSQLIDALNAPVGDEQTADCVYAYSGLKCTLAPWNALGEKYLSITLADGTPLDMDRQYTVAFWSGTVGEEFITHKQQTYDGSWEELMTAYLTKAGIITPARDGRCTLVWE